MLRKTFRNPDEVIYFYLLINTPNIEYFQIKIEKDGIDYRRPKKNSIGNFHLWTYQLPKFEQNLYKLKESDQYYQYLKLECLHNFYFEKTIRNSVEISNLERLIYYIACSQYQQNSQIHSYLLNYLNHAKKNIDLHKEQISRIQIQKNHTFTLIEYVLMRLFADRYKNDKIFWNLALKFMIFNSEKGYSKLSSQEIEEIHFFRLKFFLGSYNIGKSYYKEMEESLNYILNSNYTNNNAESLVKLDKLIQILNSTEEYPKKTYDIYINHQFNASSMFTWINQIKSPQKFMLYNLIYMFFISQKNSYKIDKRIDLILKFIDRIKLRDNVSYINQKSENHEKILYFLSMLWGLQQLDLVQFQKFILKLSDTNLHPKYSRFLFTSILFEKVKFYFKKLVQLLEYQKIKKLIILLFNKSQLLLVYEQQILFQRCLNFYFCQRIATSYNLFLHQVQTVFKTEMSENDLARYIIKIIFHYLKYDLIKTLRDQNLNKLFAYPLHFLKKYKPMNIFNFLNKCVKECEPLHAGIFDFLIDIPQNRLTFLIQQSSIAEILMLQPILRNYIVDKLITCVNNQQTDNSHKLQKQLYIILFRYFINQHLKNNNFVREFSNKSELITITFKLKRIKQFLIETYTQYIKNNQPFQHYLLLSKSQDKNVQNALLEVNINIRIWLINRTFQEIQHICCSQDSLIVFDIPKPPDQLNFIVLLNDLKQQGKKINRKLFNLRQSLSKVNQDRKVLINRYIEDIKSKLKQFPFSKISLADSIEVLLKMKIEQLEIYLNLKIFEKQENFTQLIQKMQTINAKYFNIIHYYTKQQIKYQQINQIIKISQDKFAVIMQALDATKTNYNHIQKLIAEITDFYYYKQDYIIYYDVVQALSVCYSGMIFSQIEGGDLTDWEILISIKEFKKRLTCFRFKLTLANTKQIIKSIKMTSRAIQQYLTFKQFLNTVSQNSIIYLSYIFKVKKNIIYFKSNLPNPYPNQTYFNQDNMILLQTVYKTYTKLNSLKSYESYLQHIYIMMQEQNNQKILDNMLQRCNQLIGFYKECIFLIAPEFYLDLINTIRNNTEFQRYTNDENFQILQNSFNH